MLTTLAILWFAHVIADYPLQGDFLARGKNCKNPIPGVPWYQPMHAHAFIHGTFVALITGQIWLGIGEFIAHFAIDYCKCSGYFGPDDQDAAYNFDQWLHFVCKMLWVIILTAVV